jgi:hypothetical protein
MADSFIDNPVISGLGEQLGLGDMFQSMRQNAMIADKTPKSAPNVPEYRNRPYLPRMDNGGVKPGPMGTNPTTPGTMDPGTLQSPQVQQMLGMYGVQAPDTPPDPNLFVHNPSAHPVLGGLLERGLEGLAYAHPGQNFLQSLIGGVRGMQEANAARSAQVNAQVMAPLQQAQAVQQLQHGIDEHNTASSMIDYHRAMLNESQARLQEQHDAALHRILATPPRQNPDGTQDILTLGPGNLPTWVNDPTHGNSEVAQKNQFFVNRHNALLKQYGSDAAIPPSELAKTEGDWQKMESYSKGANQVVIQNMRDATSEHNHDTPRAGTSGSGGQSGKVSQVDRLTLSDLDKQINQAVKRHDSVSKATNLVQTDDGQMLTPGSKKAQAYMATQAQQVAQLQAKKQAILNKYNGGGAPAAAAPTIPDGADGVYVPGKGIVYRNK